MKNSSLEIKELDHLVKLLDDENDFIYENVKQRFLHHGEPALRVLNPLLASEETLLSERASEIVSILNFDKVKRQLKQIVERNDKELLEDAIFAIAQFGYPGIDQVKYKSMLDKMAFDIEKLLLEEEEPQPLPIDIINTINEYLFIERGFAGNTDEYYTEDNSFINKVIDNKTGIPVSISIIYLLISKRLSLPVFGINLPIHFIIKYYDNKEEFFIDPFNAGLIITREEAVKFVEKIGITKEQFGKLPFLNIADDKEIIKRVLLNLKTVYHKKGNKTKKAQITSLIKIFN